MHNSSCNHPDGNDDDMTDTSPPPFGYQTIETVIPRRVGIFPAIQHREEEKAGALGLARQEVCLLGRFIFVKGPFRRHWSRDNAIGNATP